MKELEELETIQDAQERIDAVAADLKKKRRRFRKIDPWELASALSLQLNGPDGVHINAISKQSLDWFTDPFPARDHLDLLKDSITPARFQQLEAQGQDISSGRRTRDLSLTKKERRLLEEELAQHAMRNGEGWQINRYTLEATNGAEVCFQVIQGDAGALSDVVGPYQIHDRGWPKHPDWVLGEEW
jgi:hypothetical protein